MRIILRTAGSSSRCSWPPADCYRRSPHNSCTPPAPERRSNRYSLAERYLGGEVPPHGGIDQWIQIRGQDRNNPVLLCLHGGPGGAWIPYTTTFVPWEKDFTAVQWDQRGTGKTPETTGASIADTLSVDRMSQDGIEVAQNLRDHLQKQKIILLGHSRGLDSRHPQSPSSAPTFFMHMSTQARFPICRAEETVKS